MTQGTAETKIAAAAHSNELGACFVEACFMGAPTIAIGSTDPRLGEHGPLVRRPMIGTFSPGWAALPQKWWGAARNGPPYPSSPLKKPTVARSASEGILFCGRQTCTPSHSLA